MTQPSSGSSNPLVAGLIAVLIGIAALIKLAPVAGVLSATRLEAAYGVTLGGDASLEILMRHRAVLFGIVGGLLATSIFRRSLRPVAFVAGLVSMVSYEIVVFGVGGANENLLRIAAVDAVGIAALLSAVILHYREQASTSPS